METSPGLRLRKMKEVIRADKKHSLIEDPEIIIEDNGELFSTRRVL